MANKLDRRQKIKIFHIETSKHKKTVKPGEPPYSTLISFSIPDQNYVSGSRFVNYISYLSFDVEFLSGSCYNSASFITRTGNFYAPTDNMRENRLAH